MRIISAHFEHVTRDGSTASIVQNVLPVLNTGKRTVESKGFSRWCLTLRIAGFVCGVWPSSRNINN
jgi:hypothetical protein